MVSIKDFLLKIFGGYKGVVLTQISLYNKAKRVAPELSEDDLLNELIISRIKTRLRPAAREQEYIHYEPLLENPHKTLEDVIWAIVEYEVFEVLGVRNVDELEVKNYIEESIEKRVKSPDFKAKKTWKPVAIGVLNIICWVFFPYGQHYVY